MIKTKTGQIISNIVVSTAFGHGGDGLFPYTLLPNYQHLLSVAKKTNTSVLTKSATPYRHIGNVQMLDSAKPSTWIPWLISANKFIKRLPNGGMLNAYGLTNKGVFGESDGINNGLNMGFKIIPNIFPQFTKGEELAINETLTAIEHLKAVFLFKTIELSYSCPNTKEDICSITNSAIKCSRRILRLHPDLNQIIKISYMHSYEFAQELAKLDNIILHGINTIPFNIVFPNETSPINTPPGGVSGKPAFKLAYKYNKKLRKKVDCPIIMGCGVTGKDEIDAYFDIGANSVSICTSVLRNPFTDPTKTAKILKKYNK